MRRARGPDSRSSGLNPRYVHATDDDGDAMEHAGIREKRSALSRAPCV